MAPTGHVADMCCTPTPHGWGPPRQSEPHCGLGSALRLGPVGCGRRRRVGPVGAHSGCTGCTACRPRRSSRPHCRSRPCTGRRWYRGPVCSGSPSSNLREEVRGSSGGKPGSRSPPVSESTCPAIPTPDPHLPVPIPMSHISWSHVPAGTPSLFHGQATHLAGTRDSTCCRWGRCPRHSSAGPWSPARAPGTGELHRTPWAAEPPRTSSAHGRVMQESGFFLAGCGYKGCGRREEELQMSGSALSQTDRTHSPPAGSGCLPAIWSAPTLHTCLIGRWYPPGS